MRQAARWMAMGMCGVMSISGAGAGEAPVEGAAPAPSGGAAVVERARAVTRLQQDLVTGLEYQGQTQEIHGRMWKDGSRVRFEIKMPSPAGELIQYAAFDGRVFYTHLPAPINIAQKVDFSEIEKRVEPRKWALFNRARALAVESDPFLGMDVSTLAFHRQETLDGLEVHVYEARMEPLPDDFRGAFPYVAATAEIWIAPKDGLPRRVVHFAEGGARILSHTFRNVVVNPELDDNLFTLQFSRDTQVEDNTRKMVLQLMK